MVTTHRYNSKERQHYLIGSHYSFRLRPHLVYVGTLAKQAGWHDDPHSHEVAEILFVTDGSGVVSAGGEKRKVVRGDIVVYNAGVEHVELSSDDDPMELIFFALDKVNITDLDTNCLLPAGFDFVVHSGDMHEIFDRIIKDMAYEMETKDRFYQEISKNASRLFIMYLFRLLNKNTQKDIIEGNEICNAAVAYIDEHFAEDIKLEDIAEACYVSKYYLSHIFAKERGMSVGQYIGKCRIDEATRLLVSGNRSVNSIAEMSGFNDFSYFCHAFRRAVGMTPLQYRKRELTAERNEVS